ncbi:uncharacterized protein [Tenebrio molitor]|uniref:uncharacterized protein n=1 Tax=Tenebrio molitor TaxID=7067 RepID=UPI003624A358
MREALVRRPVLVNYDPTCPTKVHTDGKLHQVSYYSRETSPTKKKWYSYELECLAVVESIAKFRVYLLGVEFTVVTDCNALRTAGRITECSTPTPSVEIRWTMSRLQGFLHLDIDDWVLSSQLADQKLREIRDILKTSTTYEHGVYKNYALRDERICRITVNGIQWVVPKGMRRQIVQQMHDEGIKKYISACIPCLYKKLSSGRKEGFLHPVQKEPVPFHTIYVDHLGPFKKTKHGNCHLIVAADGFTKFLLLKAVKSTKIRFVIKFLSEVISTYGSPFRRRNFGSSVEHSKSIT